MYTSVWCDHKSQVFAADMCSIMRVPPRRRGRLAAQSFISLVKWLLLLSASSFYLLLLAIPAAAAEPAVCNL